MQHHLELNQGRQLKQTFEEYIANIKNGIWYASLELGPNEKLTLEELDKLAHALIYNSSRGYIEECILKDFIIPDNATDFHYRTSDMYRERYKDLDDSLYLAEASSSIRLMHTVTKRNLLLRNIKYDKYVMSSYFDFHGFGEKIAEACLKTLSKSAQMCKNLFRYVVGMQPIVDWTNQILSPWLIHLPEFTLSPIKIDSITEYRAEITWVKQKINPMSALPVFINYAARNLGSLIGFILGSIYMAVVALPKMIVDRIIDNAAWIKECKQKIAKQRKEVKELNLTLIRQVLSNRVSELPELYSVLCTQFPDMQKEMLMTIVFTLDNSPIEPNMKSYVLGKMCLLSEETEKAYTEFCKIKFINHQENQLFSQFLMRDIDSFNIFYEMANMAFYMNHNTQAAVFFNYAKQVALEDTDMLNKVLDCELILRVIEKKIEGSTFSMVERFNQSVTQADKEKMSPSAKIRTIASLKEKNLKVREDVSSDSQEKISAYRSGLN